MILIGGCSLLHHPAKCTPLGGKGDSNIIVQNGEFDAVRLDPIPDVRSVEFY
jgi:hypothetical protein